MSNTINCRLRDMRRADLPQVLDWRNSPRIRDLMYTDQPIAWEDHLNWFERSQGNDSIKLLIFEYADKPAGVVQFTQIDRQHERAYWGFYLGDTQLPPGTGTMMGLLACDYAFEQLAIRKLCAEAFAFNEASIRFHRKLGFDVEGTLKRHVRKNGQYADIVLFGLFDTDWSEHRTELEHHLANQA